MKDTLYDIATSSLKLLEEIEIIRTNIPTPNCTFVDFDIRVTKADIEEMIEELRTNLRDELTAIAKVLDSLVDSYNSEESAQKLSSVKTIVEAVMAMTRDSVAEKRRVFISHCSKDKVIVTAFVDQIFAAWNRAPA